MPAPGAQRTDDTKVLAEIAVQVGRAGLSLSADDMTQLIIPHRRTRELLAALRSDLDLTEEPATTFSATL